jgi:hypothetical protein
MIRIHTSKIPEQITLKNIKDNSYNPDYTINYNQKIITKEYFKHYIDTKGPEKLEKYVPLLLKFIRTLHPEFPSYYLKEDFNTIVNKIKNYDLSRIMIDNNTFNNNCSLLGVNYLKSKFNSY